MFLRKNRSYHNSTSLTDLLFNTLIGFYLMFAIAFMMITLETKVADIKMNAQFVITLNWDGIDDVDTWLKTPTGDIAYFRRQEIPMAHIDRDDLGDSNDHLLLSSGELIRYDYNQEITTIRGYIPGEWTLNIHMYNKKQKPPTNVIVTMQRLNPRAETVFTRKYVIKRNWREITVAKFTMNSEGTILKIDDLFEKLIRDKFDADGKRSIDQHENDISIPYYNYDQDDDSIDGIP